MNPKASDAVYRREAKRLAAEIMDSTCGILKGHELPKEQKTGAVAEETYLKLSARALAQVTLKIENRVGAQQAYIEDLEKMLAARAERIAELEEKAKLLDVLNKDLEAKTSAEDTDRNKDRFDTTARNLAATGFALSPRVAWNVAIELVCNELERLGLKAFAWHARSFVATDDNGRLGSTPNVAGSYAALVNAVLAAIDLRPQLKASDENSPESVAKARRSLERSFLRVYSELGLAPDPGEVLN